MHASAPHFLRAQDIKGKPVTSLIRKSPEGIDIKPVYTAEDVKVCGSNCSMGSAYRVVPDRSHPSVP